MMQELSEQEFVRSSWVFQDRLKKTTEAKFIRETDVSMKIDVDKYTTRMHVRPSDFLMERTILPDTSQCWLNSALFSPVCRRIITTIITHHHIYTDKWETKKYLKNIDQ